MLLLGCHTLSAQGAFCAMAAPFEAKAHFARLVLHQPAALSVFFSGRTDRFAFLHCDLELLGRETPVIVVGRFWRRSDQFTPLGRRPRQLFGGHIGRVHVLHRRLLQTHRCLLGFHLHCPGFVALVRWMRHDAQDEIASRFAGSQGRFAHALGYLHLVADMFLALFALAFGRVGRLWIVRVAHAIRVHFFLALGLNCLQHQFWLRWLVSGGNLRDPVHFGRWLRRERGRVHHRVGHRLPGLVGRLCPACCHWFFWLGQGCPRGHDDLKLLAKDSSQQLCLLTLGPQGLLLVLQPAQ